MPATNVMSNVTTPFPGLRGVWRRLSTAQALSLLTTVVVVAVLATAMTSIWLMLRQSALEVAQERVTRGVRQLSAVSATTLRQARPRYAAVAHDSTIVGTLRAQPASLDARASAAVKKALQSLQTPTDSGMPVELWTATGKRLAFLGDDIDAAVALRVPGESSRSVPPLREGLDSLKPVDSLQLGALYTSGARAFFWLVMPVMSGGRPIGFVAQQRRIAANSQAEQTLRELSGSSVSGYYRNVDGTTWVTFGGVPATPPSIATLGDERLRPQVGPVLHAEQRVAGTPFVLVMEVPRRAALARASETMRQLAWMSVGLTLLGAIMAWILGRRVARPLIDLTIAAESMALGDYSARVPARGTVELTRLGESFNRMAEQVGETRTELENREADLRALANAIPQLAWIADPKGSVVWLNERWYAYTGRSSDEAPASLWASAHDPALLPEVLPRWQASVESGVPFGMEVRLRGADGSYRWFLTRVAPVVDRDGRVSRWFGTSTDIQSLWEARQAAESGSRAKSDFLAAMSHELRTPLNAIAGYTELMEMELRGPITDQQRRDLARIRSSQQHLLTLIGSVLDLSRIESGRVTYDVTSIAVDPLLAGLEALVLPQVEAKDQVLDYRPCDPGLAVLADREKVRQILLNLLSNAIRHSPPGATITIAASSLGSQAEITVRDTGDGIPPEKHQAIFEPFVQLDRSLTRVKEGVGLGLAISRDLARGMGGDLTVASMPGQGSSFILALPIGVMNDQTVMARTMETPVGATGGRRVRSLE